jgi:hypothetical protein
MAQRYQQFLGSKPGLIIEIVDDSNSPFLVRSEEGFEFRLAADDFRNYYKKEQSPTPPEWGHLITNEKTGLVDCVLMAEVMEIIHSFEPIYQDFDKARAFVREAVKFMRDRSENSLATLREWIAGSAWQDVRLSDDDLRRMLDIRKEIYPCLISELCAAGRFPFLQSSGFTGASAEEELVRKTQKIGRSAAGKKTQGAKTVQARQIRMKNVEMEISGDILTLKMDLTKDFGPSKSGKTIIVASTEGNKTVPGRDEKIGLNVYRQESKKGKIGRRRSFKNVELELQGEILRITVDLSKELGPSKSGKTTIIASTEGNQTVFGREEKIGLNVYKKEA